MTMLHRTVSCTLLIQLITIEFSQSDVAAYEHMPYANHQNRNKIANKFVQNAPQQKGLGQRQLVREVSHG